MHPSTAAPARAQLRDHALAGVVSELRAGGGTRFGRLRRKSYLGQRETRLSPDRIGCGLRRGRKYFGAWQSERDTSCESVKPAFCISNMTGETTLELHCAVKKDLPKTRLYFPFVLGRNFFHRVVQNSLFLHCHSLLCRGKCRVLRCPR